MQVKRWNRPAKDIPIPSHNKSMRLRIAVLCLVTLTLGALTLVAQAPSPDAWKTAQTLNDVDLTGLTPVQKKAVLSKFCARRIAPASVG